MAWILFVLASTMGMAQICLRVSRAISPRPHRRPWVLDSESVGLVQVGCYEIWHKDGRTCGDLFEYDFLDLRRGQFHFSEIGTPLEAAGDRQDKFAGFAVIQSDSNIGQFSIAGRLDVQVLDVVEFDFDRGSPPSSSTDSSSAREACLSRWRGNSSTVKLRAVLYKNARGCTITWGCFRFKMRT